MKFFKKNKTIHVEFIDATTEKLLGKSKMPPENLPETFEINTTLHLGNENWSVVSATPENSSEFRKTGKLRLRLRKVQMMNTANILYSLPTIRDFLGEVGVAETTGRELTIHEDNWRNMELVSRSYKSKIKADFKKIHRIHQEQSVEHGFREIHIRNEIKLPFESISFPFDELNCFEKTRIFPGLGYLNSNKAVTNGFAFLTIGGVTWYGRQKNNLIQELCVVTCLPNNHTKKEINILITIMEKYHLDFIDWCRLFWLSSEDQNELVSYFLHAHSGK